jgi:phosphoheptose isomerase
MALTECLRRRNKVLAFGNGGSAADAQHLAAELVGRFRSDRLPLPGIALTTDTSVLTAIGNDYGFDQVFSRQVRALTASGDVIIAISTSGRSPNVLNAVRVGRDQGATTIGLTGEGGGELAKEVDIPIVVPSGDTALIQEVHITVIHTLCVSVESLLLDQDLLIDDIPKGVVEWSDLLGLRARWERERRIVVWTNGCFDVLHAGHLHLLEQAKALGHVLIVGVNSDASVRELKGVGRPISSLEDRMRLLSAIGVVDYVASFEGTTPVAALEQLKPDIHVKGEDYAPPSGKPIPEREVVEAYGGQVKFVPLLPEHSSSRIVQEMKG